MDDNLIFGRNAVIELLKSGHSVNKIFIAEGSRDGSMQKILALAKNAGVVVEFTRRDKLDKLCNGRHQGVAALAAATDYSTVEEILSLAADKDEPPFILLLDELEDPQNFGALLRTAEAVGVHGVIIPKRRSVQLNATVYKTSAGAAQYVKVAQVTNVAQTLKQLRGLGLKVVGADMGAQVDFKQADMTGGVVLIVGSEGRGMRRLTRESCDVLIKIPMVGKINSLNASAAGAVLMYEIFSQRRQERHNDQEATALPG